jgi:hypothetical protein
MSTPDVSCVPACATGKSCADGSCTPVDEPQIQFGVTDEDPGVFTPISEGGDMPIFTFGQGGSHMFVTIRAAGFDVGDEQMLEITYIMFWQVDNSALSGFAEITGFSPIGNGVFEARRRIVFISEFPEALDGTPADLSLIVESTVDSDQFARVEHAVNLVLAS